MHQNLQRCTISEPEDKGKNCSCNFSAREFKYRVSTSGLLVNVQPTAVPQSELHLWKYFLFMWSSGLRVQRYKQEPVF